MDSPLASRAIRNSNFLFNNSIQSETINVQLSKHQQPLHTLMPNFYKHASKASEREAPSSSSLVQLKRFSSSVLMNPYSDNKKPPSSMLVKMMGVRFDDKKTRKTPKNSVNKIKSSILNLRNIAYDHKVASQSYFEETRFPLGLADTVTPVTSYTDFFHADNHPIPLRRRSTLPPLVKKKLQDLKTSLIESNAYLSKMDSLRSGRIMRYKASQVTPLNKNDMDAATRKIMEQSSKKNESFDARAKRVAELTKDIPIAIKKVSIQLPKIEPRVSLRVTGRKYNNSAMPFTF